MERRVAREAAKLVREKEKAEKAAERARKIAAQNTKKGIQPTQSGNKKASQAIPPQNKRQKRSAGDAATRVVLEGSPSPPPQITSRGRSVKLPSKFR